jgi:hypothetical protein
MCERQDIQSSSCVLGGRTSAAGDTTARKHGRHKSLSGVSFLWKSHTTPTTVGTYKQNFFFNKKNESIFSLLYLA